MTPVRFRWGGRPLAGAMWQFSRRMELGMPLRGAKYPGDYRAAQCAMRWRVSEAKRNSSPASATAAVFTQVVVGLIVLRDTPEGSADHVAEPAGQNVQIADSDLRGVLIPARSPLPSGMRGGP